MTDPDSAHQWQDCCALAVRLARQAGDIARWRFGSAKPELKADNSLVTDVDLELQQVIVDGIFARYPAHQIIAEESGTDLPRDAASDYCWVIDPLDGTRNYVRGVPCISVAIGVLHQGTPVAAAVFDPLVNRMNSAVKGSGTLVDDLTSQSPAPVAASRPVVGIPTTHQRPLPEVIYHSWARTTVLRNLGSTALHLSLVASGGFDACYGQEAKLWDVAAGVLLVQEAGRVVTTPLGNPVFPIDTRNYNGGDIDFLAGTPTLHAELLDALRADQQA